MASPDDWSKVGHAGNPVTGNPGVIDGIARELRGLGDLAGRVDAGLDALLLKADVTANNEHDRELLKRFRLFGPPGTIFFDAGGNEIRAARLIGYQNSRGFLDTLRSAGL